MTQMEEQRGKTGEGAGSKRLSIELRELQWCSRSGALLLHRQWLRLAQVKQQP